MVYMDQIKYAITAIVVLAGISVVALYINPQIFRDYGELVIGIAIGAIAGLAGNELKKENGTDK
jgi:hypothetical protein